MHRTYVRRRFATLGAALALVGVLSGPMARALSLIDRPSDRSTDRFDLVSSRTHVVREGDTLWSIASALAPENDPREVIDEIERFNPRASSFLVPGQILIVPPRE
ncbi:MAG: LysM domain-containing protein [Actinomycetota bacterium]